MGLDGLGEGDLAVAMVNEIGTGDFTGANGESEDYMENVKMREGGDLSNKRNRISQGFRSNG